MSLNATLSELHRLLTQLADLRGRLERMPHAVRARKAGVAKLDAEAAEVHETTKQTRLLADRKQLDLKSSEDKIGDWNNKLNTAASNKEYQTLQDQIAAAEMANSVLADEILETLERIDELETQAGEAEQRLATAKAELQDFASKAEEQAAKLKGEIERLEGDLAESEKGLPDDFRGEYHRVIGGRGHEGLAAAEDGVCTGCGQSITLNMQAEIKMAKPAHCQSCGALLYQAE